MKKSIPPLDENFWLAVFFLVAGIAVWFIPLPGEREWLRKQKEIRKQQEVEVNHEDR